MKDRATSVWGREPFGSPLKDDFYVTPTSSHAPFDIYTQEYEFHSSAPPPPYVYTSTASTTPLLQPRACMLAFTLPPIVYCPPRLNIPPPTFLSVIPISFPSSPLPGINFFLDILSSHSCFKLCLALMIKLHLTFIIRVEFFVIFHYLSVWWTFTLVYTLVPFLAELLAFSTDSLSLHYSHHRPKQNHLLT